MKCDHSKNNYVKLHIVIKCCAQRYSKVISRSIKFGITQYERRGEMMKDMKRSDPTNNKISQVEL